MNKFASLLVVVLYVFFQSADMTVSADPVFQVQKYASCQALEDSIIDLLEQYQDRYWYPYMSNMRTGIMDRAPLPVMTGEKSALAKTQDVNWSSPVSLTNIQVAWVDEADSVKTDGNYIYAYSSQQSHVAIVRMSDMQLMKTILLPTEYQQVQLYLARWKLILVWQKYTNSRPEYMYRFFVPETQSLIAIYDITDPQNPRLERYDQIDGTYSDSRLIGSQLYLVSSTSLRIPPYYLLSKYEKSDTIVQSTLARVQTDFALRHVVPQIREARLNGTWWRYIQSIRASAASCQDITFVLPDEATREQTDFSPSFTALSSLDVTRPWERMQTQILFGDVGQIHMSQTSLYITSTISQKTRTPEKKCENTQKCLLPVVPSVSSTLIHRYALENGVPKYKYTTSIEGNPMNQYSMDEDGEGNFRIVTQSYAWSATGSQNTTQVTILDPKGNRLWSLDHIAPGENFQSARFLWNRLYLVTFQQIDPLFVIDLADPRSPKILGELIMPGYSTYLHPYDRDRLIGIGYDTVQNLGWWVNQAGIKIDLYNVADVAHPKKEWSLVLGDRGSSSEVLTNPRAFVWYKEKNLLLLPGYVSTTAHDPLDPYRIKSIYQWLFAISITPNNIKEQFRVTHIVRPSNLEAEWRTNCAGFSSQTPKQTCHTLIDGTQYCQNEYRYVPQYCYAWSTVDTYFASNLWDYQTYFVNRALYRWDILYTLAESGISSWSLSHSWSPVWSLVYSWSSASIPPQPLPIPALMKR